MSVKLGQVGVGSSAIIVHDNHLLVGKRGNGCGHGRGLWSFPGGHIDFGETSFAEQISREVYEEVGIEVRAYENPIFVRNEIKKDCGLHYITFYMWCTLHANSDVDIKKSIPHKESEALKGDCWIWMTYQQICDTVMHCEDSEIQSQWLPLEQIKEHAKEILLDVRK